MDFVRSYFFRNATLTSCPLFFTQRWWQNEKKWATILGSYIFLAYLECIRSYAWSFGHSAPDPSSVILFWRQCVLKQNNWEVLSLVFLLWFKSSRLNLSNPAIGPVTYILIIEFCEIKCIKFWHSVPCPQRWRSAGFKLRKQMLSLIILGMAIPVVEFSREGYKIRKVFG